MQPLIPHLQTHVPDEGLHIAAAAAAAAAEAKLLWSLEQLGPQSGLARDGQLVLLHLAWNQPQLQCGLQHVTTALYADGAPMILLAAYCRCCEQACGKHAEMCSSSYGMEQAVPSQAGPGLAKLAPLRRQALLSMKLGIKLRPDHREVVQYRWNNARGF